MLVMSSSFTQTKKHMRSGAWIALTPMRVRDGSLLWEEQPDQFTKYDFLENLLSAIPEVLYERTATTIYFVNAAVSQAYMDALEWVNFARDAMSVYSARYDTIDNNFGDLYGIYRLDGKYDGDDEYAYDLELDESYDYNPYESYVAEKRLLPWDSSSIELRYDNVKVDSERVISTTSNNIYIKDVDYIIDYPTGTIQRKPETSSIGQTEYVNIVYDTVLSEHEYLYQSGDIVKLSPNNPPVPDNLAYSRIKFTSPSTVEVYDWHAVPTQYTEKTGGPDVQPPDADFSINYQDGTILRIPDGPNTMPSEAKLICKYFYDEPRSAYPPEDEVRDKDNRYRNRIIHFIDAVNRGCTEAGMQKVVRSLTREVSVVHEGYKSNDDRLPNDIDWRDGSILSRFDFFGEEGCSGLMWRSVDSPTGNALRGMTVPDMSTPVVVFVGDSGTILKYDGTEVAGISPSGVSGDLYGVTHAADSDDEIDRMWAVGKNGTILCSDDGGDSWAVQDGGTSEHLYAVYAYDVDVAWVVGANGKILYTSDGGINWGNQDSPIGPTGTTSLTNGSFETWINSSQAQGWEFDSALGSTLARSTDFKDGKYSARIVMPDGSSGSALKTLLADYVEVTAEKTYNFSAWVKGDDLVFVATEGRGVWKYDGATWTNITSGHADLDNRTVYSLAWDEANGRLYAGTKQRGVWYWNGSTWTNTNGPYTEWCTVLYLKYDSASGTLYAGTGDRSGVLPQQGDGVWTYKSAKWTCIGGPWDYVNNRYVAVTSMSLDKTARYRDDSGAYPDGVPYNYSQGCLYVGTYNAGVWMCSLSKIRPAYSHPRDSYGWRNISTNHMQSSYGVYSVVFVSETLYATANTVSSGSLGVMASHKPWISTSQFWDTGGSNTFKKSVPCVLLYDHGILYAGTQTQNVWRYTSGAWTQVSSGASDSYYATLSANTSRDIVYGGTGTKGVRYRSNRTGSWKNLGPAVGATGGLPAVVVWSIASDMSRTLPEFSVTVNYYDASKNLLSSSAILVDESSAYSYVNHIEEVNTPSGCQYVGFELIGSNVDVTSSLSHWIQFDKIEFAGSRFVDLTGVVAISSDNVVAVGDRGYVISTANGGTTWVLRASGTTNDLKGVHASDGESIVAVGVNGTILWGEDDGETWTDLGLGLEDDFYGVHVADSDMVWVSGVLEQSEEPELAGSIVYYNGDTWRYQRPPILPDTVYDKTIYDIYGWEEESAWACGGYGLVLEFDSDYESYQGQFKTNDYPWWHNASSFNDSCDYDHPDNPCYNAFDNTEPVGGLGKPVTILHGSEVSEPPYQYLAVRWPKTDARRQVFYQEQQWFETDTITLAYSDVGTGNAIVQGSLVVTNPATRELYTEDVDYSVNYNAGEVTSVTIPWGAPPDDSTFVDISYIYGIDDNTPQIDYLRINLSESWRTDGASGAYVSVYGLGTDTYGSWFDSEHTAPVHGGWEWIPQTETFAMGRASGTDPYLYQLHYPNIKTSDNVLEGAPSYHYVNLVNLDTGEVYVHNGSLTENHFHIEDAANGIISIHRANSNPIPLDSRLVIDYQYYSEIPNNEKRGAWFPATNNPIHLAKGISKGTPLYIPIRSGYYSGLMVVFHYPGDMGRDDLTPDDDIYIENIQGIKRIKTESESGMAMFSIIPDKTMRSAEVNYVDDFISRLKPSHTEHAIDNDGVTEETDIAVSKIEASSEYVEYQYSANKISKLISCTSQYATDHIRKVDILRAEAAAGIWYTETVSPARTEQELVSGHAIGADVVVGAVGSSVDCWYGYPPPVGRQPYYDHQNHHAKDSNLDTFWISVGNSGANETWSWEWIEFSIDGKTPWTPDYDPGPTPVDRIRVHPLQGGMRMFVHIGTSDKGWLGNNYCTGYLPNVGPAYPNGANLVPYVKEVWLPPNPEPTTVLLDNMYANVVRLRLTFTNLARSPWGPYFYRAGLREVWAWEEHDWTRVVTKTVGGEKTREKREENTVNKLIDGNDSTAWLSQSTSSAGKEVYAKLYLKSRSSINRVRLVVDEAHIGKTARIVFHQTNNRSATRSIVVTSVSNEYVIEDVDDVEYIFFFINTAKQYKRYGGYVAKIHQISFTYHFSTYDHPPALTNDAYKSGGFWLSWISEEHTSNRAYDEIRYDIRGVDGSPSTINNVRLWAPWSGQTYEIYLKSPYISAEQELRFPTMSGSDTGLVNPTTGTNGWVQLTHQEKTYAKAGKELVYTENTVPSTDLYPGDETVVPYYSSTGGESSPAYAGSFYMYIKSMDGLTNDYEMDYTNGLIRRRPDVSSSPNSRISNGSDVIVRHLYKEPEWPPAGFTEALSESMVWHEDYPAGEGELGFVASKQNASRDEIISFPSRTSTELVVRIHKPMKLPSKGTGLLRTGFSKESKYVTFSAPSGGGSTATWVASLGDTNIQEDTEVVYTERTFAVTNDDNQTIVPSSRTVYVKNQDYTIDYVNGTITLTPNSAIKLLQSWKVSVEYGKPSKENVPVEVSDSSFNSLRAGNYFALYEVQASNVTTLQNWSPSNALDKRATSYWKSEETSLPLETRKNTLDNPEIVDVAREEWLLLTLEDIDGYPPVVDKFMIMSDTNSYKFYAESSINGIDFTRLDIQQVDIGGASYIDESDPYDNDVILRTGVYHFPRTRMKYLRITFKAFALSRRFAEKYFVAVREISPYGSKPAGRDIETWLEVFPDSMYIDSSHTTFNYWRDAQSIQAGPTLYTKRSVSSKAYIG